MGKSKMVIKMKNIRDTSKNVIMVCVSNILTILVSLFMGFILPKKISVENYAYYKIYFLYIAYAGFFHFGLVNGIYLEYGNLDYKDLPKDKIKKYFKYMLLIQFFVSIILGLLVIFFFDKSDKDKLIAWFFIIINIPLVNLKWFFSSINQFTKRFVIDSYVTIIQNIMNVIMVGLIIAFKMYNYLVVLIFTTIINLISMICVFLQNKEIIINHSSSIGCCNDIYGLIKKGFFVMLSEFVGIIILGIDSIFAEKFYTLKEFAMYSFATSIVAIIYTLITSVSNLIYPYLVRVDSKKYAVYYTVFSNIVSILSMLSITVFIFAKIIVLNWIPVYEPSILIAEILFGTIVFRVLLSLVCGNYFKALKMIKEYTINNIIAILLAFFFNIIALIFLKEIQYIAFASVLAFIVWYILTEIVFIKRLKIKSTDWIPRYLFILFNLLSFYYFMGKDRFYYSIIYCLFVICSSLFFFFNYIKLFFEGRNTI